MGCRQSGPVEDKVKDDGKTAANDVQFTKEAVDGPQQAVDERLGLTRRQLFTLDKSWKAVQRSLTATGVEMFIQYVRTLPHAPTPTPPLPHRLAGLVVRASA